MSRNRDLKIDTARGIACILLVAYHVIGSGPAFGMRVPTGHWLRDTNELLGLIRMPLFTILSGIVYAAHPVVSGKIAPFIKGKAMRLLLPLVFVGIPFAIMQKLTPGASVDKGWVDVLLVPVVRFAHYWFVQALFLVFLWIVVLEINGMLGTLRRALAVFAVSLLLYALHDRFTMVFALDKAFYLLPYFLSGLILARFSKSIYRPRAAGGAIVAIPAAFLAATLSLDVEGIVSFIEPVVGIAFAALLLATLKPIPLLSFIGFYSYTIYLFHVFGTAATRIALKKVGVENWLAIFLFSIVVGLGLPIVIHLIANRIPYVSRALLGIRYKRKTDSGSMPGGRHVEAGA